MNTDTNKSEIDELRILEVTSRTKLDQMVIALSSSFLALIFGFFKDILLYIQFSCWLKVLFLTVIFLLILCITLNVYSHHCSEKLSQRAQSALIEKKQLENYFDKKNKNISIINNVYLISFFSALFFIFIFILCSIFVTNDFNKPLKPPTNFLRNHVMSNKQNHLTSKEFYSFGINLSSKSLQALAQNNAKGKCASENQKISSNSVNTIQDSKTIENSYIKNLQDNSETE